MYRIFEFNMSGKSHTVIRLPIHQENRQSVIFAVGEEQQAVNNIGNSMLLAWFELNRHDVNARNLLYAQIPFHYVFDASTKAWKPRKQRGDRVLSRIYSVSPSNIELYHMRLLLLHVPG